MPRLFVDVDDTLILYDKAGPNPYGVYMGTPYSINERLVEGIREFANSGLVTVWSGGGRDYVIEWLKKLGLDDVAFAMTKDASTLHFIEEDSIVVDDMDVPWRTHFPNEWPEEIEE